MRASDVGGRLDSIAGRSAKADLWYARVGDHASQVEQLRDGCLSNEERKRLSGYRSKEAAERYVVTRSLVRLVLSEQFGVDPRSLALGRTEMGKPTVRGLHFNLSHSGELILLAICGDRDVGVDVERRRHVERVAALEARWLTGAERSSLQAARDSGADSSDAFLRIWSLKEARLKALGIGISGATSDVAQDVEAIPLDATLAQIPLGQDREGYVGALAFG
jgi:4'-phosphopantetheinyl transferase